MPEERTPNELREHEQATLVPAMAAGEYRAFLADVRKRGVLDPLGITAAGVVLMDAIDCKPRSSSVSSASRSASSRPQMRSSTCSPRLSSGAS